MGTVSDIVEFHQMGSLPQLDFANTSRRGIADYFDNTWHLTDILFSSLDPAAFYVSPYHRLRHPLIFYYAHPAVLYINKLRVAGLLDGPVDSYFEEIFEVGVDEMSWDDMSKNDMEWPSLQAVVDYRRRVYQIVKTMIETHPALDPADGYANGRPGWALLMAFEHERIHLETSSVLIRELPLTYVKRPNRWPPNAPGRDSNLANNWLSLKPTRVRLGKPDDVTTFGWDNEYGTREKDVPAFQVSQYLISNREFLEFVEDGGYHEERYWSDEGWRWRQFRNAKWPSFWVPDGPAGLNQFKIRTIFEVVEFRPSWPAIVNYHEAKAYCAWKTQRHYVGKPYRLLTEAEQHSLRQITGAEYRWNIGLVHGSESPVDMYVSQAGAGDVFGNVWQWSQDTFNPLPGFKVHRYYDDFSTPCFDGRHQMIFGGSFVSTGDEASPWARFHFRPHFFQHAGFRICR